MGLTLHAAFSRLIQTSCALAVAAGGTLPVPAAGSEMQASDASWHTVDERHRLAVSADTRFEESRESAQLKGGALLLEDNSDFSVNMPLSAVFPHRQSLVFVRAASGCDHIFVLLGHATVRVGQHVTQLHAGEELVVADCETHPSELINRLYQSDNIGRRRLQMSSLPDNRSLGMVEFSLVQAIEREPVLYRLIHSTDPHDKGLRGRLIKTAAVLNFVTSTHGQYVTGR